MSGAVPLMTSGFSTVTDDVPDVVLIAPVNAKAGTEFPSETLGDPFQAKNVIDPVPGVAGFGTNCTRSLLLSKNTLPAEVTIGFQVVPPSDEKFQVPEPLVADTPMPLALVPVYNFETIVPVFVAPIMTGFKSLVDVITGTAAKTRRSSNRPTSSGTNCSSRRRRSAAVNLPRRRAAGMPIEAVRVQWGHRMLFRSSIDRTSNPIYLRPPNACQPAPAWPADADSTPRSVPYSWGAESLGKAGEPVKSCRLTSP
jgi:hypothetical protein